jgi:hypothetical protein
VEDGLGLAAADHVVSHRQAIDEAGTDRLQIEGRAAGHAQLRLNDGRGGGKGFVGGGGAADHQIQFAGVDAGVRQRGA